MLARQGVPPASFLRAGRQQVKEKALAGWQKQGLCVLFKGKGRSQTQRDESIGGVSEGCCEQLNKSVRFLVPNFSQVLEMSGGGEKTQRNLQQKGNSGYPVFSPLYTQPTPKVPTRLVEKSLLGSALLRETLEQS